MQTPEEREDEPVHHRRKRMKGMGPYVPEICKAIEEEGQRQACKLERGQLAERLVLTPWKNNIGVRLSSWAFLDPGWYQ
jgi:hypothetical protein